MSISPTSIRAGVPALLPEESRYVDPSDEQLPGSNNASRIEYCPACKTTWLKGPGPVLECPSHDQFFNATAGNTKRTLVVHIDGAGPGNGNNSSIPTIGAYFGPKSSHNISRFVDAAPNVSFTNQYAEISAAIAALRRVRTDVIPQRKDRVNRHPPQHVQFYEPKTWPNGTTTSPEGCLHDLCKFKLLVAIDSIYVVNCMCDFRATWKFDRVTRDYHKLSGESVAYSALFTELFEEIELLARDGVQVQWYHVLRRYNQDADDLANEGRYNQDADDLANEVLRGADSEPEQPRVVYAGKAGVVVPTRRATTEN